MSAWSAWNACPACGSSVAITDNEGDGTETKCDACDTGLVVRGDGENSILECMPWDADGDREDAHEPCPEHCGGAK